MALDNVMGLVDVVEFEVQKYGTRDLLFSVDYATSVGLAVSAERLDIRAGIGAPIRISTDHTKSANFTSELPLVDIKALGVKLGKEAVKGATTAPKSERLAVATSTVTLKETPLAGTLKVYVLESNGRDVKNELVVGTPASNPLHYSIVAKVITVHATVVAGTLIKVLYDYTTGTAAQLVRVTAKNFAGDVRITGTGYALDESGNKAPVSFIVYRAKPTPEFEMMFANGTATNVPFNATMYPDKVGVEEVYFDIIPLGDETWVG